MFCGVVMQCNNEGLFILESGRCEFLVLDGFPPRRTRTPGQIISPCCSSDGKTATPAISHSLFNWPFPAIPYNNQPMEIVKQSQEEPAIPTAAPRQPWRFHLLVTLSMLQVLGHAINHYHLILLKPLPILLLVLLCEGATRQQRAFRLGLFFSLGGDLFLMAKTAAMFQLGTLLFMVAHVLYIRVFLYDISWGRLRQLRRKRRLLLVASIALVLTLLMFNISQLWHKTPNLPLFFIYGLVLSLMAVMASLRQGCGSSYVLVLLGAVMFGISDNALAYLKFNGIETEMGSAFVMLTYYAAQCLLYEGVRVNKSVSLD